MSVISKLTMLGAAGAGGATPWALRISNTIVSNYDGVYPGASALAADNANGVYAGMYENINDYTLTFRVDQDGLPVWRLKHRNSIGRISTRPSLSAGSSGFPNDLFGAGHYNGNQLGYRINSSGVVQASDDFWGDNYNDAVICSHPNVSFVYASVFKNGAFKVERLNASNMTRASSGNNNADNSRLYTLAASTTFYLNGPASKLVHFPTSNTHNVYVPLLRVGSQGLISSLGNGTFNYKFVNYSGRNTNPNYNDAAIGNGYYEGGVSKFKYYMTATTTLLHEFTVDSNLNANGAQYAWTTSGGTSALVRSVAEDSSGNRYFNFSGRTVIKVNASNVVEWGIQITLSGVNSTSEDNGNLVVSSDEDAVYLMLSSRAGATNTGATYIVKIPADGGIAPGTYADPATSGSYANLSYVISDVSGNLTPRAYALNSVTTASATAGVSVSADLGADSLVASTQAPFNDESLTEF